MTDEERPRRRQRPALRLGPVNVHALVEELRALHRRAEDPMLERFPAPEELTSVLEHCRKVEKHLSVPAGATERDVLGRIAVIRATLWQHLIERAEDGLLAATEFGQRSGGTRWEDFTVPMCVTSRNGAQQKARRIRAGQVRDPHELRSPRTAREHQERDEAEQRDEERRIAADAARFDAARSVCRRLVEQRGALELEPESMAAYWMGELAGTLDQRTSARERANLVRFLGSFVRALEEQGGGRAAATGAAREAVRMAYAFAERHG
ncbi:hypothetical protein [Streptomyces sp. TR02-1]|uniref:hypothetical protein n=1 Tax=Streptomyces sp. TR02-1 TaxID=3385977 RepID=UPI00399F6F43